MSQGILGYPVLNYLFYSLIFLVWVFIILVLRDLFSRGREEKLRQRIRELEEELARTRREAREEVEQVRQHYETLLKEAAIRNTIMASLYNAWRSGELKKCYGNKGELRVLADGTVICELPEKEKSYAIPVDNEQEGGKRGRRSAATRSK
ncbi:hypothetical protein PYJP_04160 [Pyrofollis japonicus]|uniref:hypothetical protein n=1 Tax=Pyrofollis japonicus TaxID=3060460 RepID=UPI00295BA8A4|nr:hypothetical protein [Pyrofollis japonicus]BEP17064.1 hypothetical protein PYJP_04160 [Pyrofollis japonicus]